MSNFILDAVKKKFDDGNSDKDSGFDDMNYFVGNSTGLDVGRVPTPMQQRIGSQSQLGGGTMEVQIYNPSTFSMHRKDIINTVDQLGLDITLHSDPNLGFTSAYKGGRQQNGFTPTHEYFTKYLKETAVFKAHVDRSHADFDVGRINPHISTTPRPETEQRMAEGVGVDPFGFVVSEYKNSQRLGTGKNMFKNDEFIERFYNTFLKYIVNEPYQLYQLFSRFSEKFREDYWRKAQAESVNQFWEQFGSYGRENIEDVAEIAKEKGAMLRSASMQDRRINSKWMDKIRQEGDEYEFSEITVEIQLNGMDSTEEVSNLKELNALGKLSLQLPNLGEVLSRLTNPSDFEDVDIDGHPQGAIEVIEEAMDDLWVGNEDNWNQISVEAKTSAVGTRLDIQQQQILENAQDLKDPRLDGVKKEDLEEGAVSVLTMQEGFFETSSADDKTPEEKHTDLIETLLNSFEQELWKESNLLYRIIPCWMKSSDEKSEDHDEFKAPKFIWEALVERKWDDKFTDLNNPGVNGEKGFLDLLEHSEEFKRDVAAASAATYVWGHFTQIETDFMIEREPEIEIEDGSATWMEWMAKHQIGVNLESMHGSPNAELKIWRPADIAVTAHAINMTARETLDEELLGKLQSSEMDNCIAKVTLDLEHVATFGVDPWKKVEDLIDLEEDLAEAPKYSKAITNEDKPLSKIVRQLHLMKPGVESQQGTYHGPFRRGDEQLYQYLYGLVDKGFARNENEEAGIMYEQGEEKGETTYMARLSMNMAELGITPEELDPNVVDPSKEYESKEEALIARFYGMDQPNYSREWAKIEEHAFDPLKSLLNTEGFDFTWSSSAAIQQGDTRPGEWKQEEYQ